MIRAAPIPVALAIAIGFHLFELGRFLQRAFFSMWLHELGHAVAAWFCGRLSLPGPWFTPVADEQSWVLSGIAMGLLAFGGWLNRGRWVRWVFGAALGLQVIGTLVLSKGAADQVRRADGRVRVRARLGALGAARDRRRRIRRRVFGVVGRLVRSVAVVRRLRVRRAKDQGPAAGGWFAGR